MHYLFSMLIGYLFGTFQSSYFLCKFIYQKDIRTIGTKNAGASNTFIHIGKVPGILVGVLDIAKAILALFCIHILFHETLSSEQLDLCLYLGGLFVILGHNFPVFLKFKGGKGTASLIGAFLFLEFKIALICMVFFVIILLTSNYIAFSTLSLTVLFALQSMVQKMHLYIIGITLLIFLISFLKHIENYRRIIKGEEIGFRKKSK